jgi:regulator of protease activity HflC (stomatin/prohibitin superfamily)
MSYESDRAETRAQAVAIVKWVLLGIFALFMIIMASCSMTTIEPGHRGVRVTLGKPGGESLSEGFYMVMPFTQRLVELDVRQLRWADKTSAYTKDVQQAEIQFVLTYALSPTEAHTVYREVGQDWSEKLVGQVVVEEIKREIGQHNAVPLIDSRNAAARLIETNITTALAKRRVIVSGFQLTDIQYTNEFEGAVEAKVVAEQRAIEEQNRTVQIKEQATQKIETARGNAEATMLNAKAEAESIRIRANALEANARLVEWEAVQKWNGVLPQYSMGGAVPFINLNTAK